MLLSERARQRQRKRQWQYWEESPWTTNSCPGRQTCCAGFFTFWQSCWKTLRGSRGNLRRARLLANYSRSEKRKPLRVWGQTWCSWFSTFWPGSWRTSREPPLGSYSRPRRRKPLWVWGLPMTDLWLTLKLSLATFYVCDKITMCLISASVSVVFLS